MTATQIASAGLLYATLPAGDVLCWGERKMRRRYLLELALCCVLWGFVALLFIGYFWLSWFDG
jgi:biotin transporter BioY